MTGPMGSQDDDRDDDENFVWFRKLNNNPLTINTSEIDADTYSMDLADLPSVAASQIFLKDAVKGNISTDFRGTFAAAAGDVDGDDRPDFISGDLLQGIRLYLNNGTATPFGDATTGTNTDSSVDDYSSVVLGDADNDGDLDLIAGINGNPNRLYLNDGNGNFVRH